MALGNEHMQKRMVKNDASFHDNVKHRNGNGRQDFEGFTDSELRSMLVRLGTKHPEKYETREELINELSVITAKTDI